MTLRRCLPGMASTAFSVFLIELLVMAGKTDLRVTVASEKTVASRSPVVLQEEY